MAIQTPSLELPDKEAGHAWPDQGQWSYEDYLRLPDDGRRYEIIEGVLYVANAPSYEHQYTVLKLASKIDQFVTEREVGVVITAPFEVHLPGIAKPVQPDVLFIEAQWRPKIDTQIFAGAPNLVIEVLSPGSIRLDQHIKFGAYERAGVREYWVVDPKTRSITIHTLPEGGQEYATLGQFGPGDTVRSNVLAGLELPVETLFLPVDV